MSLLISYLKQYKKLLFISIGLAMVNQIFSLVNPQIFRILLDQYVTNVDMHTQQTFMYGVIKRSLIGVAAALVSRLAKTFQDYYVNLMSQTIGSRIYGKGVSHAFSLPYRVFEDWQSGALLDKLLKARTDIQNVLNSLINTVFLTGFGVIIVTVYAFYVHRWVGSLFLLMVPILAWTTMSISRGIKDSQKEIVAKSGELSGSTVENIKNVTLIKSLGLEEQEIQHLTSVNEQLIALEIDKLKLIKTLTFTQGTLINLLRTVLQAVMLVMIFHGYITVGEFFSLLFYSFLLFNPLYQLPTVAKHFQEAQASSQTLEEIFALDIEQHTTTGTKISNISKISFDDVSFRYDDQPAVEEINRTLGAGETIAFVGPSGAGKSTILKLLAGLYEPTTGEMKINDMHAKDIARGSVKQRLGVVAQDTQLFTGTVRDNLLFVQPGASDEDCWTVLEQAQLAEFIHANEMKLDAKIGEGGLKLSGGQKQRLAIARALLRDPDVLVFDEATSALDSLIEAEITETIKSLTAEHASRMTILVAHRLSTVMHADRIYVLEKGQIVEQGKHDDLVAQKGLYYALWRQQSGGA